MREGGAESLGLRGYVPRLRCGSAAAAGSSTHAGGLRGQRIAELRVAKDQGEAALREIAPSAGEQDPEQLVELLSRLPDLSKALAKAPPELKRQVFEAFCVEIRYDRLERRIEISATVSEEVAKAFDAGAAAVAKLELREVSVGFPAGACLVGGIGFLTVADAGWAHAIGVASLFGFIVLGFLATAPSELARDPTDDGRAGCG